MTFSYSYKPLHLTSQDTNWMQHEIQIPCCDTSSVSCRISNIWM